MFASVCQTSTIFFLLLSFLIQGAASSLECAEFKTPERIKDLEDVIKNGGDLKMITTMTFEEFEALGSNEECVGKFSPKANQTFRQMEQKLVEKIVEFQKKYTKIGEICENEEFAKFEQKVLGGRNGADKKELELMLAAKKFIISLKYMGGEATYINVFSFMAKSKQKEWKGLKVIFDISKLQSAQLDRAIFEDLWSQHQANRPKHPNQSIRIQIGNKKTVEELDGHANADDRVLIVGAGPVGLYAAFKMFLSGFAQVTLVNSRPGYSRPQLVVFDASWQAQLRLLLGTHFDRLFHDQKKYGEVRNGRDVSALMDFEAIMHERLVQFAKYVNAKPGFGDGHWGKSRLTLLFGYDLDVKMVGGEDHKGQPKFFRVELRNRKNKEIVSDQLPPFDVFVSAGGANDPIRDKLFDQKPRRRSESISHGNTRFDKHPDNYEEITLLDSPFICPLQMEQMGEQLAEVKFHLATEGMAKVPAKIVDAINGLEKELANGGAEVLLLIESANKFSINYRTPKPLLALRQLIEEEKKETAQQKKNEKHFLDHLWERVLWKWSTAAFQYSYSQGPTIVKGRRPHYEVNINEHGDPAHQQKAFTVNVDLKSNIFDVTIQTMDVPVVERFLLTSNNENGKHNEAIGHSTKKKDDVIPVLAMVLGDGLASPHFFTGTGMSSGRFAVELVSKTLAKIHGGEIQGKQPILSSLTKQLIRAEDMVVFWAGKIVPIFGNNENEKGEDENKVEDSAENAEQI